jgi:methenyltetrahydromethanopterin cyclohydrolase
LADPQQYRIEQRRLACGTRIIDCGIEVPGGLFAGLQLAEICLAGLARVELTPGNAQTWPGPHVQVTTDHPRLACMASQYAGWEVSGEKFFAMGSGPMRAAAAREPLFDQLEYRESADAVLGVLETRQFPSDAICCDLSSKSGVAPEGLTLMLAPTASHAGGVQIVARSVETALHKLHELGFDLLRICSAWGIAPLPPIAANDLAAIGRTNDAVLYGAEVVLWYRGDEADVETLGPCVPSSASSDHGEPFADVFQRYDHDFYKIDPHLFSPAVVRFNNVETGTSSVFGRVMPEVLQRSFTS